MSNRPQRLGVVLDDLIERLGYRERLDAVHAVETWAHLAGPRINARTDRVWVRQRRLFVQVQSAVWRHQLHLQRRAWCERLNEALGGAVIDEIVFR